MNRRSAPSERGAAHDVGFKPDCFPILWFSRGRGREHARVDLAICEELDQRLDDLDVRFVSYAAGAQTLAEQGHGVLDLDLPEQNAPTETLVLAARLIHYLRPRLVVSHEELMVGAAARIFDTPCVFLTDWLLDDEAIMEPLAFVKEVLLLDQPRFYSEPSSGSGRTRYFNPVLRTLTYSAADRPRARRELGLAEDEVIISVFIHPGRRSEEVTPIFDLLYPAFRGLDAPAKRLLWLTEDDPILTERARGLDDVEIRRPEEQPYDQLMAATDIGVTKGNRNIVFELSALGVPSVSFTDQWNGIDDYRTARIPTNTTLRIDQVQPKQVQWELESALTARPALQANCPPWVDGRFAVAERLAEIVDGLRERQAAQAGAGR